MTHSADTGQAQSLLNLQGAFAFALAAALCGVPIEPEQIHRDYAASGEAFDVSAMLRAAKGLGLKARSLRVKADQLCRLPLPAIAYDRSGKAFVLARTAIGSDSRIDKLLIQYPGERPEALSWAEFADRWNGALLLLSRRHALGDPSRPFGLPWFFDAVMRYRRILGEVLMVSFALQLLGLATPLFFQVVVDKVLVHQGMSTLNVVICRFSRLRR